MGKFKTDFKIPRYFGDFGGDYSERDTVVPMNNAQAAEFEKLLSDDDFACEFDKILKVAYPGEIEIRKYSTKDGRNVFIVPAIAKYYVLAGYLAIAKAHKRTKVVMGTYSREMSLAFAKTAKAVGFDPKICLSKKLCKDTGLVEELKKYCHIVDDVSCTKMLDAPYSYINFDEGMGYEVIPIEANYGIYPRAAMTGILAGIYGQDIKAKMEGTDIDLVAASILTGTDAIGVMREFKGTGVKLATVERMVCKEFHTEDAGCFTLVTRSDVYGARDMSINPEICHYWRMTDAYRLGADRVYPVDVSDYEDAPLGFDGKRALKLISESLDSKNILFVEEVEL